MGKKRQEKNSIYQNQKVNSTIMVTIMFQDVILAKVQVTELIVA